MAKTVARSNLRILAEFLRSHRDLDVVHGYGQLMEYKAGGGRYEYVTNPRESFPLYVGATLFHRGAFEKVSLFDMELRFAEDTDWLNRVLETGSGLERLAQVTLLGGGTART